MNLAQPSATSLVQRSGADLLEYAFIIAFLFVTISAYMRFKDLELRYARLARAVALEGARAPEDD